MGEMGEKGEKPTAVYRFYDSDGQLLYVGISHRLNGRLSAHKRTKPWQQVARIDLEHHSTRHEAASAELHAIRTEKPLWNIAHNAGNRQPAAMPDIGTQREMSSGRNGGLVGWFLLVMGPCDDCDGEHPKRQGIVADHVYDDVFLVEWFSWLDGTPTRGEMVKVGDMADWRFFADQEWFDWEAEHGTGRVAELCMERRSERIRRGERVA